MMEQRTDDWFAARLGKVTASRVADVIAKTKTGYGASRANYMADLVVERLTGQKASSFSNAAMEWGTEQEPNAKAAYAAKTGILVEDVGFIDHPTVAMSGASPDGLAEDGLVEIKCPNTATHLEYIFDGKPPQKYVTQMQWQMACAGKPWCDFVSYDPRLPERLQLLVVRVPRDDDYIKMLEQEVTTFLQELDDKLNKLEKVTL
jgi:putative phage-type endonuclease